MWNSYGRSPRWNERVVVWEAHDPFVRNIISLEKGALPRGGRSLPPTDAAKSSLRRLLLSIWSIIWVPNLFTRRLPPNAVEIEYMGHDTSFIKRSWERSVDLAEPRGAATTLRG